MNNDYKYKKLDKYALILYIILTFIGFVTLMYYSKANSLSSLKKQGFVFAPMSMILLIVFVRRGNIDIFKKYEYWHYILSTGLLLAVLKYGKEILGAKRALDLFFFSFQPSYYTRIIIISSLAIYIAKYHDLIENSQLKVFAKKSIIFIGFYLTSLVLILKEPHLSIILITSAALFVMLFLANLNLKIIISTILIGIILVSGIFMFGQSYRFKRLKVYSKYLLLNPNRKQVEVSADRERQIVESLGALSAGGLWGTKSDFGSAARKFVPEANTDYIFSFIGEEYGFIISSIIVAIFFALFFRLFMQSIKVKDLYRRYFALGLSLNFIITVIVNIGVAISTLPSTGVSLPFISYGGSAFLMDSFSLAIVLNILAREGLAK
jgi:cell division protein FtsW (lipid II flippase)